MKNKILIIIICFLLPVSIFISLRHPESKNNNKVKTTNKSVNIKLKLSETGEIINLDLEDYILGVLAAEMPVSFLEEALKAQAVASRSYALANLKENKTYDFDDTISSQAYLTVEKMKAKWGDDFDRYYEKLKDVINQTRGLVMTYNNKVINAFYFSMSNGYTEDSVAVFGEKFPYLESVESIWDESVSTFINTKTINKNDFCTYLNLDCTSEFKIVNVLRNETNRVESLVINDKTYKGTDIRNLLALRSTDFTIDINENELTITTRGYGHGVGMSQYGANGMAKEGKLFNEILTYYYQNIQITKINKV